MPTHGPRPNLDRKSCRSGNLWRSLRRGPPVDENRGQEMVYPRKAIGEGGTKAAGVKDGENEALERVN
jgi:hypothetical protein